MYLRSDSAAGDPQDSASACPVSDPPTDTSLPRRRYYHWSKDGAERAAPPWPRPLPPSAPSCCMPGPRETWHEHRRARDLVDNLKVGTELANDPVNHGQMVLPGARPSTAQA
jgi:hypothetical protein